MIMGYALPTPWPIIIAAACMAVTGMIIVRDRHRDGFFVSGYRPGQTRWLTFAMVVAAWGALVAAVVLKMRYGLVWAPVAVGLATALIVTLGSIAWERVYRRELQDRSNAR
jgi:ABC-type enterochelin transport system permease subunit